MSENLHLSDLKEKIITLESIFGKEMMRSELNSRTVDNWLKSPNLNPNLSSLKRYFGVINMRTPDMIASKQAFAQKVSEICSEKDGVENYSPEDVIAIYDRIKEQSHVPELPEQNHSPVFFKRSRNRLSRDEIEKHYAKYEGQYYLYRHWKREGIPDEMIFRYFIEVHKFDPASNTIHCRYVSPNEHFNVTQSVSAQRNVPYNSLTWVYDGFMVFTDTQVYWFMERTEGFPEIITFITNNWTTSYDFYIPGVHMSLTPGPAHGLKGTYTPSASRIVLEKVKKKIKGRSTVKIGYFYPEYLQKEGHDINICDYINNEIRDGNDILSVKEVEPITSK